MSGLVLKNIVLEYSGDVALDIPCLSCSGSLGVTGLSGSGKSNFIKVVCGLEYIKTGEIFIDGVEIGDLKPSKRDFSLISRLTPLFLNKTVYQNLAYSLKKHKFNAADIDKIIKDALKKVSLNPLKRARELSADEQADLLILRCGLRQPSYVLIDEPADFAPDPAVFVRRFKQLLPNQRFILASYDFDILAEVADTFLVLKRGQIAALGSLEDIKNSKDPFVLSLCR